jgi:DNA-binding PucR family transcriptional regulator
MRNILLIISIFIILTSCSEYLSLKSIENCATYKYFQRAGDLSTFDEKLDKLYIVANNAVLEGIINEDETMSKKPTEEYLKFKARSKIKGFKETHDGIAKIQKESQARFKKNSLDNKLMNKNFVKDFEDCKKERDKSKWSFDKKWKYW